MLEASVRLILEGRNCLVGGELAAEDDEQVTHGHVGLRGGKEEEGEYNW